MKIKQVIDALEQFAPLPLQESYDNAGLQVGLTEAEVSGALLCLDVNEQIIDEAVALGCNLVVAHHPLIFRRLSCISDFNYVQRTVMKAIQQGVTIAAMHTNLDNAVNGVNYMIAHKMGLTDIRPMNGGACPPGNDDPSAKVQGVKGMLPEALDAEAFISMVKETFHVECAMCNELLKKPVRTVAVCGGAGSFLLGDAIAAGADAFVTGEMGYHEFFGHEQQIQIVVIGHYQSEQYTSELLQEIIGERCKGVRTLIAQTNTNPIIYR